MSGQTLSLGFSPCPNDTFIFHALVHGLIDTGDLAFRTQLADVETLNAMAADGALDVTKVSVGALPWLLEEYVPLRSGGAVGRGCGPLIVAREAFPVEELDGKSVAIPGRMTTANLLFRLLRPAAAPGVEMEYNRIMPAVAGGEVDAGLIIHESRFTYRDHGLTCIVDLGEWWEETTGSPIPLGAIIARRSLGKRIGEIERMIRSSVEYAFANPTHSSDYVKANAQEMSPEVTRRHIELYVNDFSRDLGPEGELAVRELAERAAASGLIPAGLEILQPAE
ncbi:MAG: 1,4-dihydroxy-6-naphthoate synthase [Gemmatimonadota bacterium]|jgi:1,4-dihydroxy-6-naphthoate synthase|nr:1,4-dihydroxy-6-naphthoate synthase [Gemmatimonadota bacterium]